MSPPPPDSPSPPLGPPSPNQVPPESDPPSEPPGGTGASPEGGDQSADDRSFYEEPVWKRFYAFLLGPALVAAAALGVFTLISVLTAEDQDPVELVQALREGGEHRRWQAAFALTKYLQPSVQQQDAAILRETDADYRMKLERVQALVPQLLEIWNDPVRGDLEVRRFLALAFSYLGDPRTLPVLAQSLTANDVELVHYALAAIGTTASMLEGNPNRAQHLDGAVAQAVITASRRNEADLRATAVYVLAVIGTETARERLREAVTDPAPAVAWNAAFGLARHKDATGETVIAEILDRGEIYRAAGPDTQRQGDLFLNAVRSAGMVATPKLRERLVKIAQSDQNLTARNEAMRLLETWPVSGSSSAPSGEPAGGFDDDSDGDSIEKTGGEAGEPMKQ